MTTIALDQRSELLQREIRKLVRKKWRIISQSPYAAQLEKRQLSGFQALLILLGILFFLIPGLIFAAAFGEGSRHVTMYIEVDPAGKVRRTKS